MKEHWPADKVERRKVADLVPYAKNSRIHSEKQIKQLADSIKEWGWTVPVLIDEAGGIIAGHGRVMAAQLLDITDVPCMIASGWSEGQRRAYVIADNKLSENSEWNFDVLDIELAELGLIDFDVKLLGFEPMVGPSFLPSVDPRVNYKNVNEADLEAAADKIENQRGQPTNKVSVTCPHCGEDFFIDRT